VVGAFCRFPFRYKDVEYNMCTLVDHSLTPDAIGNFTLLSFKNNYFYSSYFEFTNI
jgi:hypothetical protein